MEQVIKDAFAARILTDGQAWIDMVDHRNLLSHTYDPANFEEAERRVSPSSGSFLRDALRISCQGHCQRPIGR